MNSNNALNQILLYSLHLPWSNFQLNSLQFEVNQTENKFLCTETRRICLEEFLPNLLRTIDVSVTSNSFNPGTLMMQEGM